MGRHPRGTAAARHGSPTRKQHRRPGNRILIPTKGDVPSLLAAQVAGLTWPAETAVTLLTAGDASTVDVQAHRDVLFGRAVDHDIVDTPVADAVIAEAVLGYDAIVIGAPTGGETSEYVSEIMRRSPIPVVIVRGQHHQRPSTVGVCPCACSGQRFEVGQTGTGAGHPAEFSPGTQLLQLHVSPTPPTRMESLIGERGPDRARHRHPRRGRLGRRRKRRSGIVDPGPRSESGCRHLVDGNRTRRRSDRDVGEQPRQRRCSRSECHDPAGA